MSANRILWNAAHRQCPRCGRKSAMVVTWSDDFAFGSTCRWCGYESAIAREEGKQ